MAIHAKVNGLLIAVKLIEETDKHWIIQAIDEKTKKAIAKDDPKNKVFDSINSVDEAMAWQKEARKEIENSRKTRRSK